LEQERSREGKNLGVAEDGSEKEGSSGRMTLEKSDVTEADCDRNCLRENEYWRRIRVGLRGI